jgi:Nucleotide modification associated domain 2/Herpesvirus immediate early protein
MNTFIYIQTVDTGLAPCVHNGIWSLALCKPTIRRTAKIGDVVIAVTPVGDEHRLSSWAKITSRISTEIFSSHHSKNLPDNIYEMLPNGRFARRKGVKHNLHDKKADLQHDLGKDGKNAWVLISKDFFAFGNRAIKLMKWTHDLVYLRQEVTKLGRPIRKNFNQNVERDLKKLRRILKRDFHMLYKRRFKPRHPGLNLHCETKVEEKNFICG